MKTNHEHFSYEKERGNALIYVLIAIALFAALSMTLGRQKDSSGGDDLSDDKAELYATQLISYAAQTKSALDQMIFSRTSIDDLDFTRPGEAAYETGTAIAKTKRVYHPDGGGLSVGAINPEACVMTITNPKPGWYMGRFNNVDWTKLGPGNTAGPAMSEAPYKELILTAWGIKKKVCEHINKKVTGNTAIPDIAGGTVIEALIDEKYSTMTANIDFTTDPSGTPICADCYKRASLCVHGMDQNAYLFYNILISR